MSDGGKVLIELNLAAFARQGIRPADPIAEKRREDIETGRRAAQEFAYEALHGMVHLMRTSQDESIKFKAQKEIMDRAWGKSKPLTEEEKTKVIYRDHTALRLSNRGGTLKHLGEEGLPLRQCHVPSHIVTVTVSGNVLPCFEDFHEEMKMGSLHENTIAEIWNSEDYQLMRKQLRAGLRHTRGPCTNCNKRDVLPPFN